MSTEATLTPRQTRAVEALLTAPNRPAAAKAVGISERTLRRWSATDAFRAELRRQRTRLLDATASILTAGSAAAARALVEIATSGGSPRDSVRVAAARAVLDAAARHEEISTLGARLEALEEAAKSPPTAGGTPWQ